MTGYIQLELGGKKRGVKFGNYALIEYSKLNNTGVVEFNEQNPIKLCADLVYCGLKNNCFIKKEIEDFTYEDVVIWIDDIPMSEITNIIKTFEASVQGTQYSKNIEEAIGQKSNSTEPKKIGWEEVLDFAIGEVGLLPDQFYDMTWVDYNRFAYGYMKKQTKEWEHTRTIVAMIYNSNVSKKQHQKDPQKIIPLWTDNLGKKKKAIKPISKQEFHEVLKKIDKNG